MSTPNDHDTPAPQQPAATPASAQHAVHPHHGHRHHRHHQRHSLKSGAPVITEGHAPSKVSVRPAETAEQIIAGLTPTAADLHQGKIRHSHGDKVFEAKGDVLARLQKDRYNLPSA